MSLTDLQVKKMGPHGKRYEVLDGNGLFVRVSHTGHKSWIFRYRFGTEQKARRMTLGSYPMMSLAQAREKHALAMQKLAQGIDPGAIAKKESEWRKLEPTFKELLDEFLKMELSKSPTAGERKRLVEKDALPFWKDRKVSSIKRRDAVILIDRVRERAPVTANRLQGILVRMFNFASERGIIDFSPLIGMRRGKEASRSRVLTNEEIKTFWNCLALERTDIDIFHLVKIALKAILLTGQRPGEVVGMKWEHIKDGWWTLPAESTKTRSENRVPILPMMADLIEQAKCYSTGSQYVFVSARSPLYGFKRPGKARPKEEDSSLTVGALANSLRRHRAEFKMDQPYTPHDLRRTVRTRLAEIGVSDIVAERVLGHKLQGVLGIYNRHSYDEEKRQALARWERRLKEILELEQPINNVVPFINVK